MYNTVTELQRISRFGVFFSWQMIIFIVVCVHFARLGFNNVFTMSFYKVKHCIAYLTRLIKYSRYHHILPVKQDGLKYIALGHEDMK